MISVVATGDSIAARRVVDYPDAPYRDLVRLIRDADVAFTNLEIVLNDFVGPATDFFNLSADPAIAGDLRGMGFDLVSFANNHALNYGEPGVLLTLQALHDAGLPVAGAGRNLHEARRPVYVEVPSGRAALVAASSTFVPGQQATHQERDRPGRGGVNPLRHQETHLVDARAIEDLKRIAKLAGIGHPHRGLVTRGAPLPDGAIDFLGRRFAAGEPHRVVSVPDAEDSGEILRWVREARHYGDVVLVSVHCHENGADRTMPPDFLVAFARAAIDAGADAFIGHGPHRLRGLEMYRGKPIFYSLANFLYQPEYVMSLPGEAYTTPEMRDWTPHDFHEGFARESDEWDTIVPRLEFDEHALIGLTLHPVTLGLGLPLPKRGTPRLATGAEAERILRHFAGLSEKLGTRLAIADGVGRLAPAT